MRRGRNNDSNLTVPWISMSLVSGGKIKFQYKFGESQKDRHFMF